MKKAHELFAAPWSLARVAYVHARNGEIKQAKEILSVLSNQPDSVYVPSDVIASVYVALHNFDQAFQYLEKAINERAGWMIFIKLDPIWDPIRKDPRYLHILQKMNL